MSFHVARRAARRLRLEASALIDRVGELGERVRVLATQDDQLEPFHEPRIVLARPGQRRDLDRVVDHERRLAQPRLDMLLEQVVQLLTHRMPSRVLQDQVRHPLAPEGRREIDRLALVARLQRAAGGHRGHHHQVLHQAHHVVVVRVGLVALEEGELRVVSRRKALVAEHAADLVNALETSDQEPLEVQLQRDSQEEVAIEHRRVDVEEIALVEQAAHGRDDSRPRPENLAHRRVGDQVHVTLPVANLHVLQPVPFLRKRTQ